MCYHGRGFRIQCSFQQCPVQVGWFSAVVGPEAASCRSTVTVCGALRAPKKVLICQRHAIYFGSVPPLRIHHLSSLPPRQQRSDKLLSMSPKDENNRPRHYEKSDFCEEVVCAISSIPIPGLGSPRQRVRIKKTVQRTSQFQPRLW